MAGAQTGSNCACGRAPGHIRIKTTGCEPLSQAVAQAEVGALASMRRQVDQIEVYSRRQGWEPPLGALVCVTYAEARALLDQVARPDIEGDA